MSIAEPTLFSFARAAAVAAATVAMLLIAGPGVRAVPRSWRRWSFWSAMLSLFAPGFVSAYLFYAAAAKQEVLQREQLYFLLIWGRYSLLALLTVWLMPPSLSAEAMWCFRQSGRSSWWRRKWWEVFAWGRGLWLGAVLVFLLAFQEFEFATTWNMRAWSVSLFDAQAGGLALGDSLKLALLPCAVQVALITLLATCLRPTLSAPEPLERVNERAWAWAIHIPTGFAPLVTCGPLVFMICYGLSVIHERGWESLELAPWREVLNGLGLAITATLVAWVAAGWISARRGWRWLLALPGLLGPMLSGLIVLAVIQLPPLHLLRDTALPVISGLALVLLPFAVLLRFGIETTRDNAALHISRATGAHSASWLLEGFPRVCALLLLFCFSYGDFTVNTILAPPAFTSASVRLLNLLHYGQSAALGVMVVLTFALPLIVALLTMVVARLYSRRRVR